MKSESREREDEEQTYKDVGKEENPFEPCPS